MFPIIRKISVVIVSAFFLLAYTGMNITRHTCVSCHNTIYYFISHTDCCNSHSKTHTSLSTSCCDTSHKEHGKNSHSETCSDKGCCRSENIYVKATDTFTFNSLSNLVKALMMPVFEMPGLFKMNVVPDATAILVNTYRPPPLLGARQIIILFHRLIFYA